MAKSIQERLLDVAPLTQLVVVIWSGFTVVAGSLPEAQFEQVMGPSPMLNGLGEVSYETFGGFRRFAPALFTAVLGGLEYLLISFALALIAGTAWLLSRRDQPANGADALSVAMSHSLGQAAARRRSSRDARIGHVLFAGFMVAIAGFFATELFSYPRFEAPRHLRNITLRAEPVTTFSSDYWKGRSHYYRLYEAFFGSRPGAAASGGERPSAPLRKGAVAEYSPGDPNPSVALAYFDDLARWTIYTLLGLVAVTTVGSVVMVRFPPWQQWIVTSGIVVLTFLHFLQWTGLAYAYGGLYMPAVVAQREIAKSRQLATNADANARRTWSDERWPFRRPTWVSPVDAQLLSSTVEDGIVALRHYWRLRPAGRHDMALAWTCASSQTELRALPPLEMWTWGSRDDLQPVEIDAGGSIVTAFNGLKLGKVLEGCGGNEDTTVFLFDGYSGVVEHPYSTIEAAR